MAGVGVLSYKNDKGNCSESGWWRLWGINNERRGKKSVNAMQCIDGLVDNTFHSDCGVYNETFVERMIVGEYISSPADTIYIGADMFFFDLPPFLKQIWSKAWSDAMVPVVTQ